MRRITKKYQTPAGTLPSILEEGIPTQEEALQAMLAELDAKKKKGMDLAKRIYQLFKDRCAEFKQEYKLNFGVYYTPAENLCHTAMKKFRAKYGVIPNVSENDYFTNSIHVPVWKEMSVFDKIDIESQLTGYSNAGCITYIELDSTVKNNIDALETIVNYAMDKDIPYFAIGRNDTHKKSTMWVAKSARLSAVHNRECKFSMGI